MKEVTFLERLAERLLEGGFQRVLKPKLQPVQVAKALTREMERSQVVGASGPLVANQYRAYLHPDDLAAISGFKSALEREFAAYLRDYAARHGLRHLSPPTVALVAADPPRGVGRVTVEATMVDVEPEPPRPSRPREFSAWEGTAAMPAVRPPAPPESPPAEPEIHAKPAMLLDEFGRTISLAGNSTSIGRAVDNDIVLEGDSASRHHARIVWDSGQHHLLDLESTNGSFVNGRRITLHPLSDGDELMLGENVFTFHLGNIEE
jgi:hypothetical protein